MAVEMKITTPIGVLDLPNFAEGKQAQCIRLNGWKDYPGEVILKQAGEGRRFTKREVDELVSQTRLYRQELTLAGVRTPLSVDLFTQKTNQGYQIYMVDEFSGTGQDVKKALVTSNQHDGCELVNKMVGFLHDLPSGGHPFKTDIMGDFKPDNWVLDNGQLVFVDYFAPKRFEGRNGVYPYSPKIDSLTPQAINFLCADRRGQITRLLAILGRDHSKYLSYGLTLVKRIYADMPKVLEYALSESATGFKRIDKVYHLKPRDFGRI